MRVNTSELMFCLEAATGATDIVLTCICYWYVLILIGNIICRGKLVI
jgi:hypothetical protein